MCGALRMRTIANPGHTHFQPALARRHVACIGFSLGAQGARCCTIMSFDHSEQNKNNNKPCAFTQQVNASARQATACLRRKLPCYWFCVHFSLLYAWRCVACAVLRCVAMCGACVFFFVCVRWVLVWCNKHCAASQSMFVLNARASASDDDDISSSSSATATPSTTLILFGAGQQSDSTAAASNGSNRAITVAHLASLKLDLVFFLIEQETLV